MSVRLVVTNSRSLSGKWTRALRSAQCVNRKHLEDLKLPARFGGAGEVDGHDAYIYVVVITGLCFWLAYRVDVWRNRYEAACDVAKEYAVEKEKLQKEYDFLKETIASWTTKPVYALLSDQQIQEIGKTVGQFIKEPKWLN
jgi:hypothetical protein